MEINLIYLPGGHIASPAHPTGEKSNGRSPQSDTIVLTGKVYPVLEEVGLTPTADEELKKVHMRIAHFSENALRNLLRSDHCKLDPEQITRALRSFACKGVVGRATPPKVSGRMAKFNGEILGIDVAYPFVGIRE